MKALAAKLEDPNSNVIPQDDGGSDVHASDKEVKEGKVAVFVNEASLWEEFLGAVISESKVQPYKCSKVGFVPDGVPVFLRGVKLMKIIEPAEYCYVVKGAIMYLKLKI